MPTSSDNTEWPGRRVNYANLAVKLAKRRSELNLADADDLLNTSSNRTESKRAMLSILAAEGTKGP